MSEEAQHTGSHDLRSLHPGDHCGPHYAVRIGAARSIKSGLQLSIQRSKKQSSHQRPQNYEFPAFHSSRCVRISEPALG